jgi:glycosyltransferase involved in cell wall biosynthesis
MRVLLFVEHVDASRFWQETVAALEGRGVEAAFATLRGWEPVHAAVAEAGAPSYALQVGSSRQYPLAAARLLRVLRRRRIEVLHACEPIPSAIAGLVPRPAWGGRMLFDWCGGRVDGGSRRPLFQLGRRRADLVLACSQAAASLARERGGVDPDRIRLVHRGVEEPRAVDPAELEELRREIGVALETPLIAVVARLRREKGIDRLIDAIPLVERALGRGVALVVVGDGVEASVLRARAATSEAAQIVFAGVKHDVAPWFRMADVVVLPSLREPFGKSALEAIACGRPLVASAVGGLPEFVEHGRTGALVPPGDVDALAAALVELLSDPERAGRMAAAAHAAYRERFTGEAMIEGWIDCYRELLGDGR